MSTGATHQRELVLMVLSSGQGRETRGHAVARQAKAQKVTDGPGSVLYTQSQSCCHDRGDGRKWISARRRRRLSMGHKHLPGYNLTRSLPASSPNSSQARFSYGDERWNFILCNRLHQRRAERRELAEDRWKSLKQRGSLLDRLPYAPEKRNGDQEPGEHNRRPRCGGGGAVCLGGVHVGSPRSSALSWSSVM